VLAEVGRDWAGGGNTVLGTATAAAAADVAREDSVGMDPVEVALTGVRIAGDGVDLGWWTSMGRISVLSSLVFFCLGSGAFSFSWT
jgi:hypothetical protein